MMNSPEFLLKEKEGLKEYCVYYDEQADIEIRKSYYQSISFNGSELKESIHTLLEETHTKKLEYAPHRYLYPWVDLQENRELKSLYSGKRMDPAETIKHDYQILELEENGVIAASGETLLNCEHVVPQSWFNKMEPMRGDLHHLFACEPGCNSSRGNSPYADFPDYVPEGQALGIRSGCGKAEEDKFEPEYGKGIVARASFYFLLRYRNVINKEMVNVPLLLKWHQKFPTSLYEKHRNLAIYELQGNRNPFIDFPELAEKMADI